MINIALPKMGLRGVEKNADITVCRSSMAESGGINWLRTSNINIQSDHTGIPKSSEPNLFCA